MLDPILIVIILVIVATVIGIGVYGYNEYKKLEKTVTEKETESSEYKLKAEEEAKKLADALILEKEKTLKAALDARTALEEQEEKIISEIAIDNKRKEEEEIEEKKKKYVEEQIAILMVKENITREEALAHIQKMGIKWVKDSDGNIVWSIVNYIRYIYDGVVSVVWKQHPNKCLDAVDPIKGVANNIHLWDCANENHNQFFIHDKDTNQLRWNKNKDICVTRQGDKQRIQMFDCANKSETEVYDRQIFAYNDDDQIYSLKEPTQCLDVFEGRTGNRSGIVSWNCDKGSQNQKFNLKKKI